MDFAFNFMATGIGSVPFLDIDKTCRTILTICPDIPFWPQFVKRSPLEDMCIQASQGLPMIKMNHEHSSIYIDHSGNRENELISFYEHYMAEDIDNFAIDHDHACGLYRILELISENPRSYGPFIKGQIVGPITFAGGLTDETGRSALSNNEIMDTIVKGLAIKALWLVKKMSITGKRVILLIDEPYLAGFGSAFTPIQRQEVISSIAEMVEYLRSRSEVIIGIHCCGNTDWSMIMETGVDIVSFDAYDYMDYFLLYINEIKDFINNGGTIAWGIVPTTSFTGRETSDDLKLHLDRGLRRCYEWGIDRAMVTERSIITPACGIGSIEPDKANSILKLLSCLSSMLSEGISCTPL